MVDWSKENKFQLNPKKCKELRINFTKQSHSYEPVRINDQCLELVKSAKILGMLITDDLKWNSHIENTVSKASKRLYLLRQLKRANVEESSLLQFYTILEYGCQVFQSSLPDYLSMDLERVEKRALKIIYPELNSKEAIEQAKMTIY